MDSFSQEFLTQFSHITLHMNITIYIVCARKITTITLHFKALNPRAHGHGSQCTHVHVVSDHIGCHSYDLKHTLMNIFIRKIQHTPNIYQQTYPTYESLGASDRDMQRGTTLVFGIDSSEP